MPGFHIEHVMRKNLINHKRGGRGPLGPPLNLPLVTPILYFPIPKSLFAPQILQKVLE